MTPSTRPIPHPAEGRAEEDQQRLLVALTLARHALIEYAAQCHPYAGLLDLLQLLSDIVGEFPGAEAALRDANTISATGGPFRAGDALRKYRQALIVSLPVKL